MTDSVLSDSDLGIGASSKSGVMSDADVGLGGQPAQDDSISSAIGKEAAGTWQNIKQGLGPSNVETYMKESQNAPFWDIRPGMHYYERAGKGLMSALGVPIQFGVEAPVSAGLAQAEQYLGMGYDPVKVQSGLDKGLPKEQALAQAKETPAQSYERWRKGVDLALLALPGPKKTSVPVTAPPTMPSQESPFGITLSQGESAADLPMRVREQSFLREGSSHANDWLNQRASELTEAPQKAAAMLDMPAQGEGAGQAIGRTPQEASDIVSSTLGQHQDAINKLISRSEQALNGMHESFRSGLSPTGSVIAHDPLEAADIMSGAISNEAERAQAAKQQAYQALSDSDVLFHPASFNGAANKIRQAVDRADKIDINPETTPIANQALSRLDSMFSDIVQKRDELGRVLPIKEPITPEAIDDVRKRLNVYRGDAIASARMGKPSDARAMSGILDAFDDLVADRMAKGTVIRGDPAEALQQMNTARKLNTQYRQTFMPRGPGDSVGQAIQQILGRYEGSAATPEQVQSILYSQKPSSIQVANRIKSMFGPNSHEFGAARQGFYSYVTERPPGATAWGPEQVADRIDQFTRGQGRTLAQAYLSPDEIGQMQGLAQRLRSHVRGVEMAKNPFEKADFNAIFRRAINQDPKAVGQLEEAIRRIGPATPQASALRQGLFMRAVQPVEGVQKWGPKQVADNLQTLLVSTRNSPIFSPQQRGIINEYINTMRRIEFPKLMYAPTEPAVRRLMSVVGHRTAQVIGALIGRSMAPGIPLVGEFAGITIGGKMESAMEAATLGRVKKQLPLVANEVAKYQKAYAAWEKLNSEGSKKLLSAASSNLANELSKWGVNWSEIAGAAPKAITSQGTVPVGAQPNQQP